MCRMYLRIVSVLILAGAALTPLGALPQTAPPAKPANDRAKSVIGLQSGTPADATDANAATPAEQPPEPMTPEKLPAEPPTVSYAGGQLKIDSKNATLAEILDAIKSKTGTEFETIPEVAKERVAVHLSGSPRQVLSDLLYGSKFGYVILTNPGDPSAVQKVVLTDLGVSDSEAKTAAATPVNRQIPVRRFPPVEEPADAEETTADTAPSPAQHPPEPETQPQPATTASPAAPAESAANASEQTTPVQPVAPFNPSQQSSDQQPKTAEEFMQNLYRQRLQIQEQQQQQQKQNQAPPPQ